MLETTIARTPTTPSGNAQLDQFVEGGLTEQPPPAVDVSDTQEEWVDPDFDDEDRISMMEEYPEVSESPISDDESDVSVDSNVGQTGGMIRLRILKDLPEPILDESGEEIELLEGDSFNCGSLMAQTLIAAGWAEAVNLE